MKVLFVFGGIPHYYAKLLDKLQSKGVDISVVIPKTDTSFSIGEGVKMADKFSFKVIRSEEHLSFYKKAYFPQLSAILLQNSPDLLILGWPYFLQIFFSRKLRKTINTHNIKILIKEIPFQVPNYKRITQYYRQHPLYDENMQLKSKGLAFYLRSMLTMYIRRYCYRRATASLNYCSSAYNILPGYGIDKSRIFVTYNATDNEALWEERKKIKKEPLLLPPRVTRILHIGRLVKWKRVDLLIAAFVKILPNFPNTELLIVGDGPEKEALMQQCEHLGIEKNVRFTGAVHDSYTLGKYMHESTVYVLAGMGGLSINDAMAYGLPVICSVCDGTEKELVTDGYNGFFFKEGNAKNLEEQIIQLLASPDLQAKMGAHSEEIIRTKINIESVSDNYIRAFEYAMKN